MADPDAKNDEDDFGLEVGGGSPAEMLRDPRLLSGRSPNVLRTMSTPETPLTSSDLPQTFQVKYLGARDATGLWGIKHTRKPVDALVAAAQSRDRASPPLVKVVVSRDGVAVLPDKFYSIDTVSYGVQDLVYTRVFSMIVVRQGEGDAEAHPFQCHGFVCDSRHSARRLTYALAAAFHEYSGRRNRSRFAIDLRSPDEMQADSEA